MALWREGLLAQAVLAGRTRGYRHHPQLARFQQCDAPVCAIAAYLLEVHAEAARRGYRFDAGRLGPGGPCAALAVARGQLEYEWAHLAAKLKARAPDWLKPHESLILPEPHPLFRLVPGGIADWEVRDRSSGTDAPTPRTSRPPRT